MHSKCIHVLNVGDYFPELTAITLPLIERYAKNIGAKINVILERRYPDFPMTYEKIQIYEDGRNYDWNVFMDLDLLVDPNAPDLTLRNAQKICLNGHQILAEGKDMAMVYVQQSFPADAYFESNDYFLRDGRNMGIAGYLVISSRLTHDLWEPIRGSYEENKHKVRRQHIFDEYVISNNLAKYGLKHNGIGSFGDFIHIGATTDVSNRESCLKSAREFTGKLR